MTPSRGVPAWFGACSADIGGGPLDAMIAGAMWGFVVVTSVAVASIS